MQHDEQHTEDAFDGTRGADIETPRRAFGSYLALINADDDQVG